MTIKAEALSLRFEIHKQANGTLERTPNSEHKQIPKTMFSNSD